VVCRGYGCAVYIYHISYTHNYASTGYTRIHIQPTLIYGWYLSGTLVTDRRAWDAARNCMRNGGPHGIHVRSWVAVSQQFYCHAFAGILSWTSWDLEGHRYPNYDWRDWVSNTCNW
jgi:hypothetical protein